jgi:hypothetical protein
MMPYADYRRDGNQMSDRVTPAQAAVPLPPPPRRRRRRGLIGLAVIAAVGTAIGLLVAQPWKPPPLLAPVGVRVTAHSTTSAVVTWRQAPGSREPDSWVVFRNSAKYATVPSGQSSFTDSQLVPGGTYTYRIAEASGSARSLESGVATVTTEAPSVRNLRQTAEDWSTVTLRWDPPSGAPAPGEYQVYDGKDQTDPVGTVPGTVTTYTVTTLPEDGGHHTYLVYAVWSGNPSHSAPSVNTQTRRPPLSSDFQVNYHTASSPGGTLKTGTNWEDDWAFSPSCSGNTCREGLNANFQPPGLGIANTPFTVALKPSGGHYVGTTKAQIFACGSQGFGAGTNDTVNVDISPVHASGGVWSTFNGTVEVTMPYSADADGPLVNTTMYCPAQTWTFTVGGSS